MAFEIDSIVTHKILPGKFIVKANKENSYDGRNSSPFHQLIKVKEGFDYKIILIKDDSTLSAFIDAKEDDLDISN
jgi:hypothetical protein